MKIESRKVELPSESVLHERIASTDFIDCFMVKSSMSARKAAEIIVQFPQWTQPLFRIRRIVTAPFGLSNDGPPETEFVAGFDDKHQNFRVSVMSQSGRVYLATWVHPNNIGGRIYLFTILPFHVMIARDALKRVALQS